MVFDFSESEKVEDTEAQKKTTLNDMLESSGCRFMEDLVGNSLLLDNAHLVSGTFGSKDCGPGDFLGHKLGPISFDQAYREVCPGGKLNKLIGST